MISKKNYISAWWLIQLCVIIFGAKHLGHLLVVILLLLSIIGFIIGGRKTTILASFGFAAYAALTLVLAIIHLFFIINSSWIITAIISIVAILNIIISFQTLKTSINT
ncbi:MAG: hypothetical protein IKX22_13180 [Prevotella sp.]|nr:hypothetical protein [Bacteroidales bacterium]MBR5655018.1 hypothetical protein [Prevotella sp.]